MRAAACCLIAALAIDAAAQAPTFSTRVVSVPIDALVLDDRGRPVVDLGIGDFELLDGGVPQKVDFVTFGKLPVNVVFALDVSASMAGDRLVRLREAAGAVIGDLKADDQAGLLTFSHVVRRDAPLTRDRLVVRRALARAEPSGETALYDAVYGALLTAQADVGRNLVIVFSDGADTCSWLTPDSVVEAARRSNAVVYALVTAEADRETFLHELTRRTGGSLAVVEWDRDVRGAFLKALEEFRSRYLLSFSPPAHTKPGWHTLQVRVRNRRVTVRAREGYVAGP